MEQDLAQRVAALERRLAVLEDARAIEALKARYAELVDRRYRKGAPRPPGELAETAGEISRLFSEDAVWDGGPVLGRCRGRAEIAARMREPTLAFSWHFFLKPQITVEGGRARGRWDILSPCTTREGKPHWLVGTEDDEYVKRDGVWLHESMRLSVVFLAPHETGWTRILV